MGLVGVMSLIDGIMFLFFVGVTTFFMLLEAPNISVRLEQRFGKDSETDAAALPHDRLYY